VPEGPAWVENIWGLQCWGILGGWPHNYGKSPFWMAQLSIAMFKFANC
jgi:hypothetical protein